MSQEGEQERIICHIDLDAFYCQVEHVRLGIPTEVPLCVQQWNGLIAVNYKARELGISRHFTVQEALKKCPTVKLVHVATYFDGDEAPKYNEDPKYATHKVSLDVYRSASSRILAIMKRFCKHVERASIDEAYLDLTHDCRVNDSVRDTKTEFEVGVLIANQHNDFPSTQTDFKLFKAGEIVSQVRKCIFEELGYTCSAGISVNKTLSKLCSSMFKPNKQSILRLHNIPLFMKTLPFQKIRHLGGKLGQVVEAELNCEFAGDIVKYSKAELVEKFSSPSGEWLYDICRGVCNDAVIERSCVQSMGACKSFRPHVSKWENLHHWISILASELYNRLMDDFELNKRWPKSMTIAYRNSKEERTKSFPFMQKIDLESPSSLSTRLKNIMAVHSEDLIPCSRLAVNLNQFQKYNTTKNLLSYFKRVEKSATSYWCKNCFSEIQTKDRGEHEDYHFALAFQEKDLEYLEKVEEDFKFALELQEQERREISADSNRKKIKLTDYFEKKG